MEKKIFAMDMDGTCLDSRSRISDETLTWLHRAKAQGVEIIPTTGCPLSCIPHQLKEEKIYRYVITSNGAVVTDTQEGKTIFSALMPLETAVSLMEECEGSGLGMTAHIEHEYLLQGRLLAALGRLHYGKDASNAKAIRKLIPYAKACQKDVEELQFFFFSQSACKRTQASLAGHTGVAAAYTDHYVEIYSKDADKGTALAAAARYLSIPRDNVACIGDGENDTPMFQEAGIRFAMGNAVPALKSAADKVVFSNDENGVAQAIQCLLKYNNRRSI